MNFSISVFLVLVLNPIYAQVPPAQYNVFIEKADSLFKLNEYKSAAENYSLAFKTFGWKSTPMDRYKAARAWALANVTDSAFEYLDRMVNKIGYSKLDEIVAEEDFTALHSDKRWEPLLDRVKRNKLPTGWYRSGNESTSYQMPVSYTHLRAHETVLDLVCRLLLEKKIHTLYKLLLNPYETTQYNQ